MPHARSRLTPTDWLELTALALALGLSVAAAAALAWVGVRGRP